MLCRRKIKFVSWSLLLRYTYKSSVYRMCNARFLMDLWRFLMVFSIPCSLNIHPGQILVRGGSLVRELSHLWQGFGFYTQHKYGEYMVLLAWFYFNQMCLDFILWSWLQDLINITSGYKHAGNEDQRWSATPWQQAFWMGVTGDNRPLTLALTTVPPHDNKLVPPRQKTVFITVWQDYPTSFIPIGWFFLGATFFRWFCTS